MHLATGSGKLCWVRSIVVSVKLRRATQHDSHLLWEWRNDPEVRRQSFTSDPIPWSEHEVWFTRALNAPSCQIFIGEVRQRPVGVVRFDITGNSALVNIIVAERGKGYGSELLCLACEQVPRLRLVAEIKGNNIASQKIFAKAGFRPTRMER